MASAADKVSLGPPPRWLRCPRKGVLIGNKFVPSKVPLSASYDKFVKPEFRYPVSMVISSLDAQGVSVGLWIDLTNTDRFYDRADVEHLGVEYRKLNCRGFGQCPSPTQVESFIEITNEFLARKPNKHILVHCTHGFNRTGFLICAYLVEQYDWSIEKAAQEFGACRTPGVLKQHYLEELFERYGEGKDTAPAAPETPEWCEDFAPELNEDEAEATTSAEKHTSSEASQQQKQVPKFEPHVDGVEYVTIPAERRRVQQKVQKMCNWRRSGFPGSQPVSMDRENIAKLSEKQYYVSWKADGYRYLMLIEGTDKVYMFDRDHNAFKVEGLRFPARKAEKGHVKDTLVDGEMVLDTGANGDALPRFLIYDIIRFDGMDSEVLKCRLSRRFECIQRELIDPRKQAKAAGTLMASCEPFSVRLKEFYPVESKCLTKFLSPEFEASLPHEIDGLIFQPDPDAYAPGRCAEVLKWKPAHMNSVDFKLAVVRESGAGMVTKYVGHLYVLGMDHPFAKIKMTRTLKEHDKKIIECKFDKKMNEWVFMRVRTDKSYPNAYTTAAAVCASITNPVTKEDLLKFVNERGYRKRKAPDITKDAANLMPPPKLPTVAPNPAPATG